MLHTSIPLCLQQKHRQILCFNVSWVLALTPSSAIYLEGSESWVSKVNKSTPMSSVIRLVNTVELSGRSSPCHQVPCFWTCHVVVVQVEYPFPSAQSAATVSCFFQSGRCFLLCWTKPQVVPGTFSFFFNSFPLMETALSCTKIVPSRF